MEFLRQLVRGIAQAWQRLSASARINIVLAAGVCIAAIALFVAWGTQPQYVRLYSGLQLDDSANIETYLKDQEIPYKLEDGGQTIKVPVSERTRIRVALTEQGLPRTQGAAPGFELLDRQELMSNRWLQDINYMRAVQGELQRQLNEFDFVNKSFVFISPAPEELFVGEEKASKAAVTLDATRSLTPREVKAVLGIVSSFGGTTLNPANITLTTTDGKVLYLPPTDEFASIANSKLEYIREYETQREEKAMKALAELGVNAIVKVSADVDFDSVKETINKTSEGTPISSLTNTTTTSTTEKPPEGPPGATTNLPAGMGAPGGTATESTTEETIDNFQPSTTVTERTITPGQIKKYRVSAFVEGNNKPVLDDQGKATGEFEYEVLTDEQIAKYRDFIAAAVGVGVEPADIKVYDHPFKIDRLASASAAFEDIKGIKQQGFIAYKDYIVVKFMMLIVGFILVRWFLRKVMVMPPSEEETVEIPLASPDDIRRQEIATEVDRLSREQPDVVAALLRSWLSEEEE